MICKKRRVNISGSKFVISVKIRHEYNNYNPTFVIFKWHDIIILLRHERGHQTIIDDFNSSCQ